MHPNAVLCKFGLKVFDWCKLSLLMSGAFNITSVDQTQVEQIY